MRKSIIILLTGFIASMLLISAFAEPEVRRALPVDSPAATPIPEDYANPSWMNHMPPPQSNSQQSTAATPAPTASAEKAIPTAPAATANDQVDQIRRTFDLANSLYSRKMYDLAIPEYEMFLISSHNKEFRDVALFRLAECHRALGNDDAARANYEKLVMEFKTGEFVGAGAYRLAEFLFADKLYEAAHTQYEIAAHEAKEEEIRLSAKYFSARSLDYLRRDADAETAYKAVVGMSGKNPYREHALLALADISVRNGKKAEGLAIFEELANTNTKPEILAEATVKAASLAAKLGQKEKALSLFEKALKVPNVPDWKAAALLGALQMRYQSGDYRGSVVLGKEALKEVPAEKRPETLQILATSYRQLGNNLDARRTYDLLLRDFPNSAPAQDARFQRLICLYALNDKNLLTEIDAFIEKSANPTERTQAFLLKAETLFKQGNYTEAGKIYESLSAKDIGDNLRADTLYKQGWCLAATENYPAAVAIYSKFLQEYPEHTLAPAVLAQRALAQQKNKALDAALEDFDLLISKYPKSKERELALQQKALIYGQQQKYDEMKVAFQQLLKEFPKSAAAAQANFWLGWAAFEQQDYKGAIELLDKARQLDAAQYMERASLRIILSYYYLQDRDAVAREAENYKGSNIPPEITLWLAMGMIEAGKYAKAEALLLPLTHNPAAMPPEAWINLAEIQNRLEKFRDARTAANKFLESARDPATRARGLLANARSELGLKNFTEAGRLIEEALLLQPEGRLNSEARLASGDLLLAQSDFDGAARAYMTLSVLTDDPAITPRALQLAAEAYRRANNKFEAEKALTELHQRFPDFQKSAKASKDNNT